MCKSRLFLLKQGGTKKKCRFAVIVINCNISLSYAQDLSLPNDILQNKDSYGIGRGLPRPPGHHPQDDRDKVRTHDSSKSVLSS